MDDLTDTITAFADTWNEHFAHPFKWTYKGHDLAEKLVRRFIEWLVLRRKEMKQRFLHKQLQLLSNLVTDYWSAVPPGRWRVLHKVLLDSAAYLGQIIDGHNKTQESHLRLLSELSTRLLDPPTRAGELLLAAVGQDKLPS